MGIRYTACHGKNLTLDCKKIIFLSRKINIYFCTFEIESKTIFLDFFIGVSVTLPATLTIQYFVKILKNNNYSDISVQQLVRL